MKTLFYISAFALSFSIIPAYPQWIEQTVPGDIDVTLGIDFINQNHGVMGGWHFNFGGEIFGNAFYTTDSGTNWIESAIPDSMRVIVCTQIMNDNIAYGAGAYNQSNVNCRQDNFQSNQIIHPSIKKYAEMIGMTFNRQEDYRGYFVETTDGGLSWHPKGSFQDSVYYLVGISFLNQQTGFVLASGPSNNTFGAILKTTDGGNNWNYVYPFEHTLRLNDIKFLDEMNGVVVGTFDDITTGVVLRTTDGGNSWSKIILPFFAAINKVTYLNANTLLLSGTNLVFQGVIYKSEDGGVTWQEFRNYGEMESVNEVKSLAGTGVILICGVTQQSGLSMPFTEITIDNGLTWHYSQLSGFQDYYPFTSEMVDESHWYLTGTRSMVTQGFVLFTDNSGGVPVELISFTAETVDGKIKLSWTTATELNNLGFEVERKSDNEDWRAIGFIAGKGTTTETQNYNFVDDLFGVADLKIFYRLKQIDFNGIYDYSKEIEVEKAPGSFSLEQNYPNPFKPSTKIKFTIPQSPLLGGDGRGGFVSLKVYDVLGNEVATLVNEELLSGNYEVEFDSHSDEGQNLSSGIYFYQLVIRGSETRWERGSPSAANSEQALIQTKKMILMK